VLGELVFAVLPGIASVPFGFGAVFPGPALAAWPDVSPLPVVFSQPVAAVLPTKPCAGAQFQFFEYFLGAVALPF